MKFKTFNQNNKLNFQIREPLCVMHGGSYCSKNTLLKFTKYNFFLARVTAV